MSASNRRGDLRSPAPQTDPREQPYPSRRSIRLPEYDYAVPNAYFLTICAAQRRCLFGCIIEGNMRLSSFGRIVEEEWLRTAAMRPALSLDEHIVMPNHLHAIVVVEKEASAAGDHEADREAILPMSPLQRSGPSTGSLGAVVGGFKSAVTRRIKGLNSCIKPIWQRNYYEYIIRSEKALDSIRSYILSNPLNWAADCENPAAIRSLKATEPWHR